MSIKNYLNLIWEDRYKKFYKYILILSINFWILFSHIEFTYWNYENLFNYNYFYTFFNFILCLLFIFFKKFIKIKWIFLLIMFFLNYYVVDIFSYFLKSNNQSTQILLENLLFLRIFFFPNLLTYFFMYLLFHKSDLKILIYYYSNNLLTWFLIEIYVLCIPLNKYIPDFGEFLFLYGYLGVLPSSIAFILFIILLKSPFFYRQILNFIK